MSSVPMFDSSILDGDILVIVLRGNLDSASTPEFDRQVNEHLEKGYSKIIIDCRYLGYVSSIGLGSLVALQARLRRKGGEVKLSTILGPVNQILRAVHLDKVLSIYGDLEFARKSFYE
ncbi:MAG: STAS domain-containing protein [Planctomycetes bacterium]|nr:STAS domain-containing protein [Planctomycetota bacterium]